MVGNPIDKRRAERFSELMDTAVQGAPRSHRRTAHDDELVSLVAVGEALSDTGERVRERSRPSAQFQADLRAQLVAAAEAQNAVPRHQAARQPVRPLASGRCRMVVASALAAGVLGLSGVSTASGSALPGDTLYPVKRSTERAQLAMVSSDTNRGQLYFEFARTRLGEAREATDDVLALRSAFDDMDNQVAQGVRAMTTAAVERREFGLLDAVDDFVDVQSGELRQLRQELTVSGASLDDSMDLLNAAGQRSQQLRESLWCTVPSSGDSDRLGPVPRQCGSLPGGEQQPEPHATRDQGTSHGDGTESTRPDASPSSSVDDGPRDPSTKAPNPSQHDDDNVLDELGESLDGLL